jgi:hypothetical protein
MPRLIVEYVFDPPATEEQFDVAWAKLTPCLQQRDVKWVRSLIAVDRRRRICVFDAPDAESVRESYRSAGVHFERVWSAEELTGDD